MGFEMTTEATADRNSNWQVRVRGLLAQGYGVEDIALRLSYDLKSVQAEVKILRQSGELRRIYPNGSTHFLVKTAKRMMRNENV